MGNNKNLTPAVVEVKKDLVKKADVFRKEAKENLAKVKKSMKIFEEKVQKYVKENPVKASAIAAGVGAILGAGLTVLLGRKKRDK